AGKEAPAPARPAPMETHLWARLVPAAIPGRGLGLHPRPRVPDSSPKTALSSQPLLGEDRIASSCPRQPPTIEVGLINEGRRTSLLLSIQRAAALSVYSNSNITGRSFMPGRFPR